MEGRHALPDQRSRRRASPHTYASARHFSSPTQAAQPSPAPNQQPLPEGATVIARSPVAIDLIKVDRRSGTIAFVTGSISHRLGAS